MEIPFEMRKAYLDRRNEELNIVKKNMNNPDFGLLKKWGHQIKGNAKSFDFQELIKIALLFEEIAETKNLENLVSAINNFELVLKLCAQRLMLEKPIANK